MSAQAANAFLGVILALTIFSNMILSQDQASQERPRLQFKKFSGDINVPDPVAIGLDDQGRVFVTQTRRRKIQDLDIREHRDWIPIDVGLRSVEEKKQFYRQVMQIGGNQAVQKGLVQDVNEDGEYDWRDLTVISEVIYRLSDADRDGTADEITVFAEDFKTEVTGVAAGVMAYDGDVYATVAPDLWKLTDQDGDGEADHQESIAHGFGLHIAYGGHDMHGLAVGPDGKIYWSIGDKGINVTTKDGKNFAYPNQGGVMRCNPDGSDFEVFAHGLRNVQELAFDQYGNLFGVDNDADQTDERERFVYIVNQMDAGWRCNYQYRGAAYNPWTDEKLWQLPGKEHPAYIIPPISHYVDGPAGFKFNPGTALNAAYKDYFFLTSAPNGYQYAFQVEEHGDSFRMINDHLIGSGLAIVGLAFGPDGALYGADWDGGYPLDEKGAVIRIDVAEEQSPERQEVQSLLQHGFTELEQRELVGLLGHEDMRVRMRAQFELVSRGDAYSLAATARDTSAKTLARLHGVWGLGQLSRQGETFARDTLGLLLADMDVHVRRQSAKTYGELHQAYGTALMKLLSDDDAQVRTLAGLAISRHPTQEAVSVLLSQAEKLEESQYYLRHSIVTALSACADEQALAAEASHENIHRRLCCALALRRLVSPKIAVYLDDASNWIADAAARGIHDDDSIMEALPQLAAALPDAAKRSTAFLQRAVNANYRLGDAAAAHRLAAFAEDEMNPLQARLLALDALQNWQDIPLLDRVDGRRRPAVSIEREIDRLVLQRTIGKLARAPEPELAQHALAVARSLNFEVPMETLQAMVRNEDVGELARVEALRLFADQLASLAQDAIETNSPSLQLESLTILGNVKPEALPNVAQRILASETELTVQQHAIEQLGRFGSDASLTQLTSLAEGLVDGRTSQQFGLDINNALSAAVRGSAANPIAAEIETVTEATSALEKLQLLAANKLPGDLSKFAFCSEGGDAQRGRDLFRNHVAAQCSRCHRIGRSGSDVGPELTRIAEKRDANYLLRSIVSPSADIEEKYRTENFLLDSGEVVKGVLQQEKDGKVLVADSKGEIIELNAAEIEERVVDTISLMPDLTQVLTPAEVRDLVAYLRSMR
ncbi:MAG: c-type cytochrome [Planctomycetales bacterium]|nr:c-type cytochrome [Planctomycetales bacterium]